MPMFGEGGQRTMAAMRGDRAREPAEVIDPAAHDRLDALEGRVSKLEDDARQDEAEDGEAS
jgi:hypothetical protein